MSMITATAWTPRGHAAAFPTKYVFDDDEYGRIAKFSKLQLEDAEEELAEAREEAEAEIDEEDGGVKLGNGESRNKTGRDLNADEDIDDDLKEYNLDKYDDDDEEEEEAGGNNVLAMFGGGKGLAFHESNADDPYITLPDDEVEDEDREETQILPEDNLVLAARVEDEVSHLEVYVYEDEADNLYVHHDIMLPDIPLCVEWLDIAVNKEGADASKKANFVAIGTMSPDIEIWDLDTVDCMFPNAILGQGADELAAAPDKAMQKKKKKTKKRKANDDYHVDAVLSLAANRQARHLLASSSADKTIKLWDLNTAKCAKSYAYHTDKVCSVAWHPTETTALLSGSYDRTVVVADMRAPNAKVPRWGVESDVETVRWDPHKEHFFFVTTENGFVHYHDARNSPSEPSKTKPLWSLQAHDEVVSAFDVNPIIPGYLVTGSYDKMVKLWNITPSKGPSMVVSRDVGVGKVFSTTFAPDKEVGFRLAVAGSKGALQIWDTSTNAAVRSIFADRVGQVGEVKERITKLVESDTDSDSEEGDEDGEGGWEDDDNEDDDEDEEMEG